MSVDANLAFIEDLPRRPEGEGGGVENAELATLPTNISRNGRRDYPTHQQRIAEK
jgi:hypothetical protein